MVHKAETDEELMEGLKNRDIRAYEACIERYKNYVGAVVVRQIGNTMEKEDVEEVVADVFFELWKRAEKIVVTQDGLKPYLAAVSRNLAVNKLRKRQKFQVIHVEEYETEGRSIVPIMENLSSIQCKGSEDYVLQKEQEQLIQCEIAQFKSPDRELFVEYHYQGATINELSKQYGVKENTVKSKLLRCRKKLSRLLKME